jgi:protocatechuate 3,4-dioxygenase beta subunit
MTLCGAQLSFTRRSLLLAGTSALVWGDTKPRTPACALTAEQEEGPYYIDESAVRGDITEGKPGLPLQLRIQLVDAKRCEPIKNAAVDIWHCDALGVYSGFGANSPDGPPGGGPPPDGFGPPPDFGRRGLGPPGPPPGMRSRRLDANRFLRGVQFADKSGRIEFATLYPGWYSGRAIHIHLKVHLGGHVCHTGQLFFPEDITADVAKLDPYATRLQVHRTTQSEDSIFNGQHGSGSMLDLVRLEKGVNSRGFLATVTLAVDPEATPPPVRGFGPGGPRPG